MYLLKRGFSVLVCCLLLLPAASQAQTGDALNALGLGGGGSAPGGPGSAAEFGLSCSGRGADGDVGCGDIGLEEIRDLCVELEGEPGTVPTADCEFIALDRFELDKDRPLVLYGVTFEFGSARLTPESRLVLDRTVAMLRERDDALISVDGHTDNRGSETYNERLSRERARTVRRYFIDAGLDADRLVFRGFGESRPVAPNTLPDGSDNPVGRSENRRVELSTLEREQFEEIRAANEAFERRRREVERARAEAADREREAETADRDEAEADEEMAPPFDESEYMDFLDADGGAPEEPAVIDDEESVVDGGEEPADEDEERRAGEVAPEETEETARPGGQGDEDFLDFLNDGEAQESSPREERSREAASRQDRAVEAADEEGEEEDDSEDDDEEFDSSEYLRFLEDMDEADEAEE